MAPETGSSSAPWQGSGSGGKRAAFEGKGKRLRERKPALVALWACGLRSFPPGFIYFGGNFSRWRHSQQVRLRQAPFTTGPTEAKRAGCLALCADAA